MYAGMLEAKLWYDEAQCVFGDSPRATARSRARISTWRWLSWTWFFRAWM